MLDYPSLFALAADRNGSISDIDPTNVVLPTPNPPATTILTGVRLRSEVADAIEHLLQ